MGNMGHGNYSKIITSSTKIKQLCCGEQTVVMNELKGMYRFIVM